MAWAKDKDLGKFEFAFADIPFFAMIRRGEIGI
jgi:hypothetical protein